MHPEILLELHAQRSRDLQEQAHQAVQARTVSRTLRALRRRTRAAQADEVVIPAIPDYVDGSFRTAGDGATGNGPGNGQSRMPAARRAA